MEACEGREVAERVNSQAVIEAEMFVFHRWNYEGLPPSLLSLRSDADLQFFIFPVTKTDDSRKGDNTQMFIQTTVEDACASLFLSLKFHELISFCGMLQVLIGITIATIGNLWKLYQRSVTSPMID